MQNVIILKKNIGLGQFFVYFKLSAQFRKPMTHSNNKYHEKSVVDVLLGSNCCHRCSESSAIPLSYSGTLEVALFKWCNKCPVNFRNRLAFTCSIRIIALDRHVNCWNFSFNLLWYVQWIWRLFLRPQPVWASKRVYQLSATSGLYSHSRESQIGVFTNGRKCLIVTKPPSVILSNKRDPCR